MMRNKREALTIDEARAEVGQLVESLRCACVAANQCIGSCSPESLEGWGAAIAHMRATLRNAMPTLRAAHARIYVKYPKDRGVNYGGVEASGGTWVEVLWSLSRVIAEDGEPPNLYQLEKRVAALGEELENDLLLLQEVLNVEGSSGSDAEAKEREGLWPSETYRSVSWRNPSSEDREALTFGHRQSLALRLLHEDWRDGRVTSTKELREASESQELGFTVQRLFGQHLDQIVIPVAHGYYSLNIGDGPVRKR